MKRAAIAILSIYGILDAQHCLAQSPEGSDEASGGLEEVVVTALKRSESILSTPVSVTAMDADALRKVAPRAATDLAVLVPGLQVNTASADSTPVFSLRGVSQNDYAAAQSGPVGLYTDEVYRSGFVFFSDQIYDLDRIEVLRGPQGTLYGRNVTGGAINFVTAKPTFDQEGYVTLGGGNFGTFRTEGAFQPHVSDQFGLRLAFTYNRADGWQKNINPGGQNLGARRDYGVRLSARYAPSEAIDAVLRVATSQTGPGSTPSLAEPFPTGIGGGLYALFNSLYPNSNPQTDYFPNFDWKHTAVTGTRFRTDTAAHDVTLNVTWHPTPAFDVISISAFNRGFFNFIEPTAGNPPLKVLGTVLLNHGDQVSQEFRIASDAERAVSMIAGAIYSRDRINAYQNFSYYTDIDFNGDAKLDFNDCLANLDPAQLMYPFGCVQNNRFSQVRRSVAAYADWSFKLTPTLKLHVGARYTRDRLSVDGFTAWASGSDGTPHFNAIPGDPANVFAPLAKQARNYSKPTGRIGIDYEPVPGTFLYANLSRGYRTGALNAAAYNSIAEFGFAAPEVLDAAEVGWKGMYFSKRLQLSSSIFYYRYKDQQALNVDPATFLQSVLNINRSNIKGGEVELAVKPVPSFTVRAGLSVLRTTIDAGTLSGTSLVGNRLPLAPKTSGSLSIDWKLLQNSTGTLSLFAMGRYTARQYVDLFNDPNAEMKAFAAADARLSFDMSSMPLSIALVGKNLTDKFYYKNRFNLQTFGFVYNHIGEPRTYGIEATYSLR